MNQERLLPLTAALVGGLIAPANCCRTPSFYRGEKRGSCSAGTRSVGGRVSHFRVEGNAFAESAAVRWKVAAGFWRASLSGLMLGGGLRMRCAWLLWQPGGNLSSLWEARC